MKKKEGKLTHFLIVVKANLIWAGDDIIPITALFRGVPVKPLVATAFFTHAVLATVVASSYAEGVGFWTGHLRAFHSQFLVCLAGSIWAGYHVTF